MGKNDLDFKENPGWRVSFSIIIGVAWLAFVIIWLAFFAGSENFGFNGYQNFAIILASILVVMSLLGESWASWGKKHIPKESKEIMKTFGFKWRIQSSIIIPFLSIIFLIIWFFFYAINFNLYQNIAVFLVTFIIMGGILGTIWTKWGMKHGSKFESHAASYYHHEKKDDENEVIDLEKKE